MASIISGSQFVIAGGNFHQINTTSKDPFERLLEATSPAAFHDSDDVYDCPKCHPNTRVDVLNKIMDWIHNAAPKTRDALIMWLYGPAGSGKSAIARSIADLCAEEGILIATTIAYQISLCFPDIRDRISGAIGHDPFIFSRSLNSQISSLITGPLQGRIGAGYFNTPNSPRIIIIDGLDECEDRDSQVKILDAISQAIRHYHLPFIFLVASRPEPDIRTAFCFGYLSQISSRNPLDDDYLPSEDVRLFLHDKFAEIKNSHPFCAQIPSNWPSEDALRTLVDKSSGQFIYASTVVKFIKSTRHRPPQRLEIVLGIRPAKHEMPFAELDALYMHIFSSVVDLEPVMHILAYRLISRFDMRVSEMEMRLSLDPGDIAVLLCDLTSLISVEEFGRSKESFLHIFHASLQDFLFDQSRSKQFWINAPLRCAEFAILYLKDLRTYLTPDETQNIGGYIADAALTPELRESVAKLSLASYLAERQCLDLIPRFLTHIKSHWKIDGASIYIDQLQRFDHFARGILANMYTDSRLTALVAVAKLDIDIYRHYDAFNDLFSLRKSQDGRDKLSFSWEARLSSDYRRFILKFLDDPSRAGLYLLTGERYATAAVYLLKYICNQSEQTIPSYSTVQRKLKKQVNAPWNWRNIVAKANSSEAAHIVRWQRLTKQPMKILRSVHISGRAFWLALRCLAYVLPRADSSEALTVLAHQHPFGPLTRNHRRSKKAVKREIARYLAKIG
ncbi:hypothetical protein GALMADRAFT_141052 [Galerina marginata CBS 339.88]|uniref:Nephrocystin 3-like N-terminal domain-containing protein n=1 Tax=Galerina marginata (strain CBS 339.88) TaxID=685588 RepID=A0A067T442_GALM3|nr:hypothetical protein GALMADRAFT_141052 [Galerina marginata CBS 339.88]